MSRNQTVRYFIRMNPRDPEDKVLINKLDKIQTGRRSDYIRAALHSYIVNGGSTLMQPSSRSAPGPAPAAHGRIPTSPVETMSSPAPAVPAQAHSEPLQTVVPAAAKSVNDEVLAEAGANLSQFVL